MKNMKQISSLILSSRDRSLVIHQVNLFLELFNCLSYKVLCCTSVYTNLLCYDKLKYL